MKTVNEVYNECYKEAGMIASWELAEIVAIRYAKEVIDHMVGMGNQDDDPEAVIYTDGGIGEALWDYNAIDYLKKSIESQIEE